MIKKILQTVLFAAAFAATGLAAAAPVGYVHEVKGDVTLRDAGKQPAKAAAGDTFEQGASFTTGTDGNVTLKFEDGQLAVIAPNSLFIAQTYVFNKAKVAESNILFSLTRGGLRFVSGMIASTNRNQFAIRTPTATAGVRGTDGNIALGTNGSIMASTSNGDVTLTSGGVTITIPAGATSIAAPGAPPGASGATATIPIPPALAAVAALVRAIAVANVPNNAPANPVAVANAIKAAVAAAAAPGNAALQAAAAAALATAQTANQALVAQAIAGGGVLAAPPATGPGAPAPALTTQEIQVLLQPLVVPCVPSAPATTC